MPTLVSVIIPSYNSEEYISECIESVLAQSHNSIEIICVDNNSQDSTFDILLNYQKKYPLKVKVYKELQKGASFARNKGINESSGEWIQFLDSDDLLMPNKISTQLKFLSNNSIDFIVGGYIIESKDGISSTKIPLNDVWAGLILGQLGYTCSNLFKKSLILKSKGWRDVKSSQEYYFMFDLIKLNPQILISEAPLTRKRENNPNSISNKDKSGNWSRFIDLRMQIHEYMIEKYLINSYYDKLIKTTLLTSIRILFKFDKDKAYDYYQKFLKKVSLLEPISFKNKIYIVLSKLIGFYRTEKLIGRN